MDFADGPSKDNIIIYFYGDQTLASIFDLNIEYNIKINSCKLNEWYFMSIIFKGNNLSIYYNGTLMGTAFSNVPRNKMRSSNYIGRSNWNDPYVNAKFDDLKFFNRALNQTEILDEMGSVF
jgi:hypothetical protein